jgi:hypothetical protein
VGERRGAYRVLVGKPEGKRTLGSSRHRWEDDFIYLPEIRWQGVNLMVLAQDRARDGLLLRP